MSSADRALVAAVFVKSVPVGGAPLRVVDGALTREGLPHGLDPINEVAVEWALQAREAGQVGRVVAVCMGPPAAHEGVRRALALGCDEAVLVTDDRLAGADVRLTARTLAAAFGRVGADIAYFGYESLDGSSGAVPAAVAAAAGVPVLTFARVARVEAGEVHVERDLGDGPQVLQCPLPAVVSVVAGGIEPRFPVLKAVLDARRRPVETLDLDALGVSPQAPVAREEGVRLVQSADAGRTARRVPVAEGVAEVLRLLGREVALGV